MTLGERAVSYADRNAMPYTTAVLTEIQRFRGVAYVTRRYASTDVTVQGHNIPKGENQLRRPVALADPVDS